MRGWSTVPELLLKFERYALFIEEEPVLVELVDELIDAAASFKGREDDFRSWLHGGAADGEVVDAARDSGVLGWILLKEAVCHRADAGNPDRGAGPFYLSVLAGEAKRHETRTQSHARVVELSVLPLGSRVRKQILDVETTGLAAPANRPFVSKTRLVFTGEVVSRGPRVTRHIVVCDEKRHELRKSPHDALLTFARARQQEYPENGQISLGDHHHNKRRHIVKDFPPAKELLKTGTDKETHYLNLAPSEIHIPHGI